MRCNIPGFARILLSLSESLNMCAPALLPFNPSIPDLGTKKNSFALLVLVGAILLPTTNAAGQRTSTTSSAATAVADLMSSSLKQYQMGNFEDALAGYRKAIEQEPKSGEAYAGAARCLLKQEKISEAFDLATQGVAQAPDSAAAHTAMGEVLFRKGAIYYADVEFVKAANHAKPEARAFLGKSRIEEAMSLYAQAKKHLDRAHVLDPTDPEIHRAWLGTLHRADQIKELEQYLAGLSNDDLETREWLENRLELLKEKQQQPSHSCKLATDVEHTETRLEQMLIDARHLRGYGLRVSVNGQTARLLLDTGAGGLLINRRMAEKAGVKPVVQTKLRGIGDKGPTDGYIGYADSIKVGGLEFQNCLVEVSEKRSIAGEDGLVGSDVFSHFLVTIDFPQEKLILSELPKRPNEQRSKPVTLNTADADDPATGPENRAGELSDRQDAERHTNAAEDAGPEDRYIAPEMKSYTQVYRFGHALLIPTRIGSLDPKLFLIDTGGFTNEISPAAAHEVTKVRSDPYTTVRGISGSVKEVKSADKVVIQFGHFRQQNEDIISFDLTPISRGTGTEVSGILGFTLLHMLTIKIDYRDGLVDFEYKRGPWD